MFFFCGCENSSKQSFNSLSEAFVNWYYKNNPTYSSKVNIQKYDGAYKLNSYKDKEQYLLDLNRFYFELTQINSNKLSTNKKKEYDRLENFMTKLLYIEEDIRVEQWSPIFDLLEIEKGLKYLLNYNYLTNKNKIESLNSRINKINKILDNSLINLFFISEQDATQAIKKVDLIDNILTKVQNNIESNDNNYSEIVNNSKNVILRLKRYKKDLKGAISKNRDEGKKYVIDNHSFSIMTESDIDINTIYSRAIKKLRIEQIKLFNNCLPIYLRYEDEPIWVDYKDTLDVISYVVDILQDQNKINNFSYLKESYDNNIKSNYDLVQFNFYNNILDLSYLNHELDIVLPMDSTQIVEVNLPEKYIKNNNVFLTYNKPCVDLINAHNIYPGHMYLMSFSHAPSIIKNFPNMTILRGAQRYAERIFVKTNKNIVKAHEIFHQRNLISDMLACIIDIDYHLNNKTIENIQNTLIYNSFLDDIEILNLIDKLKDNYFGYLSQKYIGYSSIMDLEKEYFTYNDRDYWKFYHKTFKTGVLDLSYLKANNLIED